MNMNKTIFTKEMRRRREKCYPEGARDARRAYTFKKTNLYEFFHAEGAEY